MTNYTHIIGIIGDEERYKEVGEILTMLGGHNKKGFAFNDEKRIYFIGKDDDVITSMTIGNKDIFRLFTVKQFWETYPYKVGDTVSYKGSEWTTKIIGVREVDGTIGYRLTNGGVDNYMARTTDLVKLEPLTELQKEDFKFMLEKLSKVLVDRKSIEYIRYLLGALVLEELKKND